jgi:hypothetical protein
MKDLLMILNPRRIEECIASYQDLDIDRLWIKNMSELQIDRRWPEVMEAAEGYDRLLIVSDDAVVRQPALDAVLALLDEHPVVTGYANLGMGDYRVNLNKTPLAAQGWVDSFNFYTLGEVFSYPAKAVPTTLVGFALTGMSIDLWRRYRFDCDGGADFRLSQRLAGKGIPMVGAREGFIWHVKESWGRRDQDPRKRLLVGEEPAAIELETR